MLFYLFLFFLFIYFFYSVVTYVICHMLYIFNFFFDFRHWCPTLHLSVRFWTLVSGVRFLVVVSDFEHCWSILDSSVWVWTKVSDFIQKQPDLRHECLVFGGTVRLFDTSDWFRHQCPILDTGNWYWRLVSDFRHYCPSLDTSFRCWSHVSI